MAEPERFCEGPVLRMHFGGILEGRTRVPEALDPVVGGINALDLVQAELEVEGGRYSLLFDSGPVAGKRATPERLAQLVDHLSKLVQASGDPGSAESTLRFTEVYAGEIRETLIQVEQGRLRTLSRVRPLSEEEGETPAAVKGRLFELRRFGVRRAAVILALLLSAFGLWGWRSGYLDRIFSRSIEEIARDTGPFGDDLALRIEKSWGDYELTITRGKSYPRTVSEIEKRKADLKAVTRRAAFEILVEGGRIYAQLLDAKGEVLESAPAELRPLIAGADGKVTVKLAGRILARTVRLSLERGDA